MMQRRYPPPGRTGAVVVGPIAHGNDAPQAPHPKRPFARPSAHRPRRLRATVDVDRDAIAARGRRRARSGRTTSPGDRRNGEAQRSRRLAYRGDACGPPPAAGKSSPMRPCRGTHGEGCSRCMCVELTYYATGARVLGRTQRARRPEAARGAVGAAWGAWAPISAAAAAAGRACCWGLSCMGGGGSR